MPSSYVVLREGLASVRDRSGFDVVVQAADATELLGVVRDRSPQPAVVNIRMPPTRTTEGLDAARVIRAESPDTGILVLSAHVEVEHATELVVSGRAIDYLLKNRVTDVAISLTRSNASPKAHRWSAPHSFRSWSRLAGATTLWRCSARASRRW
jgi:DNA-binding NarL/FixJ family response regulator